MWSTHLGRETRKRWQGGGHCPLSYTANPLIYALSLRYTNTNTHKCNRRTHNMYIHNGHCLVLQTVNQLIYTLLYNIDNTNTDIQKNTATQNTNTHAVICKIVYSIAKPVLNLTQKFREKHKNCTFPGPIHTHPVLEYYDMRNAQFSLCMTQQLKTKNDNPACWFPPQKLLFHTSFHGTFAWVRFQFCDLMWEKRWSWRFFFDWWLALLYFSKERCELYSNVFI